MPVQGGGSIASRLPYGPHTIILFTLTFAALVLVLLVTFSSPFISSINFINLPSASGSTTFGSFGWCAPGYCLPSKVGYEYGTQVNKSLTGAMLLWAISVIFTFFTLLSVLPLLFVHESRALRFVGNRVFFMYASELALLFVVASWVLSIYGWHIALRAFQEAGTKVHLGSANWLGLTAAFCMIIVGICSWPVTAWDSPAAVAQAASAEDGVVQVGPGSRRGLPVAPDNNGYYHYKRTVREVVPRS